uniref:c-Myc-binding protein n=1 Tax=Chlamydomonas leiostraca TaxID=1034604 RepID=A0A7S0WTD6_9CHLO
MAGVESQKETFRKYLESAGAVDVLVKVLVSLYEEPEKPKQALDYIKTALGAPTPQEFEAVVAERDGLKKQVADLQQRMAELEAKLAGQ